MSVHDDHRTLIKPLRDALQSCDAQQAKKAIMDIFAPDAKIRLQHPFREGLSDNTRHLEEGVFFGDHNFVAFTGWPSGTATHSGDGFLGLAPTGKRITRCSLDFWRVEDGLVRECWVMVDVIDLYRQLGVDVFARMDALTQGMAA